MLAAAPFDQWVIQAQVPGIPVHVLQGVSHWLMLDAPDEVNRQLDAFLAGLE